MVDHKEWRLDIQRVAVRPHDKFYNIIFHIDDLGTRTAFFQRVRRVITDEKKGGGGYWTFNRRGGSSMYYNGIISTPNLRLDAPIIYECFRDLVKHNQLSHFTFKQVIFPFYEGNTQFSGIGFNVLRSHLRVIGNLPSSIRFQLHERTKTREALSLCKTCHLIISPSDKATHQCVPTCRGCLQPLAAEGKDNDGRCTKKRCIHRYTTESVCPRCPDGSNLHDPVACPLIQSTKSIDMEEFFSSLESTNYPPNQGRSPSYSEVASGRSQQQRTAADSSKSRIAAVPTPTTPPAAPFNAEAILTPPILLAIGKMIRQAIDESNLHGRIAKLEEAVAVISSSRATQQQRPPSPTQRYDRSPSPYH